MSQERLEETFQVTQNPSVSVDNIRGSIRVESGNGDQIHVTAVKHGSQDQIERTEIQIWQYDEGGVHAKTNLAGNGKRLFGLERKPCKVDYTVQVPQHCALTLKAVSAAAHIQDLAGPLSAKSVSGPISAKNLEGDLLIESVSGNIDGGNLIGDLILKTVSGDVKLDTSDFGSVQSKTVSGDISMTTGLTDGPYSFKSVSGDIKLEVPTETGGTIRMSSISGVLDTGVKSAGSSRHRGPIAQRQVFELAGEGPDINFHTVSGTFRIRDQEGGKLTEQVPPQTDPTKLPNSRTEILEKIANGELSVDAGAAALQQD